MLKDTQNQYVAGLDGLRAFAIFLIIAYHLSLSWASGGFLGVDIFFVLSGYLITSKLYSQSEDHEFRLISFWKKRYKRIAPSMFVMMLATLLWAAIFSPDLWNTIWKDACVSSLYMTNWWYIFHKVSYFDSFGKPSPLKHLWFLAVQEQFYFLWPLVLTVWFKFFRSKRKLVVFILMAALGSALLMGILYVPSITTSRVYYGTDTRVFELLTGSMLALLFPFGVTNFSMLTKRGSYLLDIAGFLFLCIMLVSLANIDEFNDSIYRGGFLLLSFNTAMLILMICNPRGIIGKIFSVQPLRWIGTRSFQLYLWHYPVIILTTPVFEIGNPSYVRIFFQLAVIAGISELAYRYIEQPIRKKGIEQIFKTHSLQDEILLFLKGTAKKSIVAICSCAIILLIWNNTGMTEELLVPSQATVIKTTHSPKPVQTPLNTSKLAVKTAKKDLPLQKANKPGVKPVAKNQKKPQLKAKLGQFKSVLLIGDSIMLDIAPGLKNSYSNVSINGKVGRQMREAVKLAGNYALFNDPQKAIVLELGTNGYFRSRDLKKFISHFTKANLFLVNTRVPRSWERDVNQTLKNTAQGFSNTTLVDWYSIAIHHPEYFTPDGVHLTITGSKAMNGLLAQNLAKVTPKVDTVQ